jgi:hypothetical protein
MTGRTPSASALPSLLYSTVRRLSSSHLGVSSGKLKALLLPTRGRGSNNKGMGSWLKLLFCNIISGLYFILVYFLHVLWGCTSKIGLKSSHHTSINSGSISHFYPQPQGPLSIARFLQHFCQPPRHFCWTCSLPCPFPCPHRHHTLFFLIFSPSRLHFTMPQTLSGSVLLQSPGVGSIAMPYSRTAAAHFSSKARANS